MLLDTSTALFRPLLPAHPASILKLDNGLTVIHQEISTTPVTVVDVWVRAGAATEPNELSGMAHFLEHMIFKGTDRLAPGVFDQAIENRGGVTNAATSYDYAHYFITTATEHLPHTLPSLADLLLHATIPYEEFVRERDVVLEELRQALDDPDWVGFQALSELVYQQHPYGRSILGNATTLMQQTPEQMRGFHRSRYQPETMTVAIVGSVSQQMALELVHRAFTDFPAPADCAPLEAAAEPPITTIRRQELYLPRLEQARLMLAWIGPGIDQVQAAYGLDVIAAVLADAQSSRLVRELREERQLVQAIGSSFSLRKDSSLFTITALLEPQAVAEVEALICTHVSELATLPIPEPELARTKRLLCNEYIFSTESPDQLAGLYGYYQTIAHAELAVAYPDYVRSVSPDYLQHLANHYLSPHHYAAIVLKPR